jgi:7-cyano-7-deazaguanine synthase in queuosine biosynthesis
MAKDLAIILNNGSINSAVVSALAAQKYRLVFLHAEVAQQPGSRVRAAYDQQVAHFKPFREHTLPMPWLTVMQPVGRSAGAAATQAPADPRIHAPIGPQLVDLLPLVAAAARFAAHYSAAALFVGLRVGPHGDGLAQATEYVQVWNELLQMPCSQPELEVQAPLLELEPWQVVDLGFNVAAPFERTWSCTEEGSEACWACRGCRSREAAFQQAGKPDPLRAVKGRGS